MSLGAAFKRIGPSWVLTISDRGPEGRSPFPRSSRRTSTRTRSPASTGCVDPAFAFFKPVDTSLPQSGNEADCHGVWGVNDEIWIIDQAATGTVKPTQTFSKCAAVAATSASAPSSTTARRANAEPLPVCLTCLHLDNVAHQSLVVVLLLRRYAVMKEAATRDVSPPALGRGSAH